MPKPVYDKAPQLARLLGDAGIACILTDADHCVRLWNAGAQQRFMYTAQEAMGKPVDQVVPLGTQALKNLASPVTIQVDGLCGQSARCRIHAAPVIPTASAETPMMILGTDAKIREHRSPAQEPSIDEISHFAPIGIFHARMDGRIETANSELAWMLGYESAGQLVSRTPGFDRQVVADRAEAERFMFRLREAEEVNGFRCRLRKKDNASFWAACYAKLTRDDLGRPSGFNGYLIDISHTVRAEDALKKANQKLGELADKDGLTRIANRRRFDLCLDQAWRSALRRQAPVTLMLCDIDFFKQYNDTYGHQAGDACLQQVAAAIQASVLRPEDLAARYGGEEFGVILPDTGPNGGLAVAGRIADAIQALQIPHKASSVCTVITLSTGLATLVPDQAGKPGQLIAMADTALYKAKNKGRNQVVTA